MDKMSDLISRQALRETMYHEAFETDSDMQKWDSGCWIRYKMFENAIEAAPTIDQVKHGKLIASEETNSGGLIRMVCSECNRVVYSTYGLRLGGIQFCPYCGVKMGRSEDDKTAN